jgi:multiple sugar transport system ATP-binding protein
LEHVTKRFKTETAVDDVSAQIQDGEFVVILGASGSGKSTILRIIAGLEVQTSGHVYIGDMLVDDYEPRDRNLAMVFQTYALYPHLSIYQNIGFALKVRHVPKPEIDRAVRQVAARLGISETLRKRPAELSGGQRQRVALARAIVRNPEAFLLDEPLSNLDAKIRTTARIELKRIHSELKQTFVFVTHDQAEAMTLADRLAVLSHGRLLQFDTPQKIMSDPADQYVASFVGSPEMVFLEGTVVAREGALAFVDGPVQLPVQGLGGPGRITIGIRPWDVSVRRDPRDGGMPARVTAVERLGSSDQLFLDLMPPPGERGVPIVMLRALARAYDYTVGDAAFVQLDAERALFFDVRGERLESVTASNRPP